MSDFNQWRFRMHSSKSWIPPIVEVDEKPHFNENVFASCSTSGVSATLPRRKPRPKLMSYLGGHGHQSAEPEHFLLDRRPALSQAADISTTTVGAASEVSKEITAATEIRPDVELPIIALMSRLLANPGKGLSVQDTSLVLRVIESYRELGDKVTSMEEEFLNEKEKTRIATEELQRLEAIRASDEKGFRAEIKRLEMVIAEGKRGMSDLLKARQGSLIRRSRHPRETSSEDGLGKEREAETAQAHLDETEKPLQRWRESPTRTVRLLPQSPSRKMANLSKQFSTSNLQHEDSLRTHSRGYESYTEPKLSSKIISKDINTQKFTDAENSSVSSCGDPPPDEFQRIPDVGTSTAREEEKAIWQMAGIFASRKGIDVADVIPALIQFFQDQPSSCFNVSSEMAVGGRRNSISGDLSVDSKSETEEEFRGGNDANCLAGYDLVGFEEVSPKTSKRRFSFCPNDDDAAKLRESWNKRKVATERFNVERPTSSSTGTALVSPKLRNSESCPNCSLRSIQPVSHLSRRPGNQDSIQIYSPNPDENAIVMSTAATSDEERSDIAEPESRLLGFRKDKDMEKTCGGDSRTKLHRFARFPSSGSQHSVITAIWQDTNPDNNDYETDGNRHHCQHASCDSTRGSFGHGLHVRGQNLATASLSLTEPESLLEH